MGSISIPSGVCLQLHLESLDAVLSRIAHIFSDKRKTRVSFQFLDIPTFIPVFEFCGFLYRQMFSIHIWKTEEYFDFALSILANCRSIDFMSELQILASVFKALQIHLQMTAVDSQMNRDKYHLTFYKVLKADQHSFLLQLLQWLRLPCQLAGACSYLKAIWGSKVSLVLWRLMIKLILGLFVLSKSMST